jgi:hypothetical protein
MYRLKSFTALRYFCIHQISNTAIGGIRVKGTVQHKEQGEMSFLML